MWCKHEGREQFSQEDNLKQQPKLCPLWEQTDFRAAADGCENKRNIFERDGAGCKDTNTKGHTHTYTHTHTREPWLSCWISPRRASLMWFGLSDGVTAGALLTFKEKGYRESTQQLLMWIFQGLRGPVGRARSCSPQATRGWIKHSLYSRERREALKIQQAATKSLPDRQRWPCVCVCVCVVFWGGGLMNRMAVGFVRPRTLCVWRLKKWTCWDFNNSRTVNPSGSYRTSNPVTPRVTYKKHQRGKTWC